MTYATDLSIIVNENRTNVRTKREEEFTIEEAHINDDRSGIRKSKQLNVR